VTDEFSRPATLEDLKLLLRALNARQADYLLIGGFALHAHGYTRATVDIDLLLAPGRETGDKVKAALMDLPDGAAGELESSWFEEKENIRVADAFVVDLMFSAAGKTYDDLKGYAETIDIDGVPARTINLKGLLLTKQTVRDKDKADRQLIETALKSDPD
jgi:hypothetical protein